MKRNPALLLFFVLMLFLPKPVISEETASNFTLTDIDSIEFSLSDYRGKIVILDFFATWCPPCVAQIPQLKAVKEVFGENLIIISISIDPIVDTKENLIQFRNEHEINWTITRDTVGLSLKNYSVTKIPTTIIIDQHGYLQYRHVGPTDQTVLTNEITRLDNTQQPQPPLELILTLSLLTLLLISVGVIIAKMTRKNEIQKGLKEKREPSIH